LSLKQKKRESNLPLSKPQRKRPSVLTAFVDEVLGSKTCELAAFAQLKKPVYRRANRLKTSFTGGTERLPRQDFLHVDFDRHASRASLCRQLVGNFYRDFHFALLYAPRMRFRAIWSGLLTGRRSRWAPLTNTSDG